MDALLMNASTATSSKVLVEKRDGRVVDFDPDKHHQRREVRLRRP